MFASHAMISQVGKDANIGCARQGGPDVKLLVQEPAFTATDKTFCSELGLNVVEGKEGFEMVDGHAMVFGVHLYIRTWHEALRTLPALFVGTGLESWQGMTSFKPDLRLLLEPISKMHADYDHYSFPDLGHIFSSTCLYWKTVPAEDTAESTKDTSEPTRDATEPPP